LTAKLQFHPWQLGFLHCFTDYGLEFPNKTVTDFVHIWGMPSLTQFTVCFWMKSSDSNDGTPFSYAVPGADNELLIAKYNNFAVWVGDEKRYVLLLTCNNFCFGFGLTYFQKFSSQLTSILVYYFKR